MACRVCTNREIDEALREEEEDKLALDEGPLDAYNSSEEASYFEEYQRKKQEEKERANDTDIDDNDGLYEDDGSFYEDVGRAMVDDPDW